MYRFAPNGSKGGPAWHRHKALLVCCALAASTCSVPQLTVHSVGQASLACSGDARKVKALVVWGPAWRSNQKEPTLRSEIAGRAIENFFNSGLCFDAVLTAHFIRGRRTIEYSDQELIAFAAGLRARPEVIVVVRVEELGPLLICNPGLILWEGGTETVLRVRVLDVQTQALLGDIAVRRRDTGPYVLRGTGSLDKDIQAALKEVFEK